MIILLALSGVLIAVMRHLETGIPFKPGQEKTVWLVEARVDFIAGDGPVSASLSLPEQIPGGDVRDPEVLGHPLGLRPFAGARSAEEDPDHLTPPP